MAASVTAALTDLTVRLTHESPDQPEYAVIAVDGQAVVNKDGYQLNPPYDGHSWAESPGQIRATLRPNTAYRPEPGPARVTAAFRAEGSDPPTVLETTVTVFGEAAPFVLPTAPSGQTVAPPRRSLFYTDPLTVEADGIAADLHAAGVTHLETGAFISPVYRPGVTTFRLWREAWEAFFLPRITAARRTGFRLIAQGEEFIRTAADRDWLANTPWAGRAVGHVAAFLRYSGIVDAIEVNDETGPNPADYGPAAAVFLDNWRDAGGPPVAWPTSPATNGWEVPALSDYTSRQGDPAGLGGPGGVRMPFMPGLTLSLHQHARFVAGQMSLNVPTAAPWGALLGVTDRFYREQNATPGYQPGADRELRGATPPHHVPACVWIDLAHGASFVRAYSYDWPGWRDARASGQDSPHGLQQGTAPGDARWTALAAAFNAWKAREGRLAGTPYSPVRSGPWVIGRRGDLAWCVNTAERELPAPNGPGVVLSAAGEAAGATVPAGGVAFYDVGE